MNHIVNTLLTLILLILAVVFFSKLKSETYISCKLDNTGNLVCK